MPDTISPLSALIRHMLDRAPDMPAIEYEGRWLTWGWFAQYAQQVSQCLKDSGAAANAPVALVARNHPSSLAALLALLAEGRTVRMIYAFQSAEAVAQAIVRLEPAVAILDARDATQQVVAALEDESIAGLTLDTENCLPISGAEHAGAAVKGRQGPREPLIEILTSGTTGPPKQFPIRHSMVAENMIGREALEPAAQEAASALPPSLLYFPLGNISGIYSTIPTLVRGQRARLLERFSIEAWHNYVLCHRPHHSGVPPSCMRALLDADIPREDLASIKAMGSGAAPLDPALHVAFEDRYGIPILLSYGATEFGGPVCAWSVDLHARWGKEKRGSVGQPILGAKLRVVDPETGALLPTDSQGRLEVVSPRIGPDWIRTSDLARIDADGFLWLIGRADGAIMRGGFKILPETIERALLSHPEVMAAVVIGVPDARLGAVPAAAVRLCPAANATPETLESWLRKTLLATQIPVHWRICEAMPLNASMKVDRPALRRLFVPPRTGDEKT